jgi:hypothetical protein
MSLFYTGVAEIRPDRAKIAFCPKRRTGCIATAKIEAG